MRPELEIWVCGMKNCKYALNTSVSLFGVKMSIWPSLRAQNGVFSSLGVFLSSGALVSGDRGLLVPGRSAMFLGQIFGGFYLVLPRHYLTWHMLCVGMQRGGFGNVVTDTSSFPFVSVVCWNWCCICDNNKWMGRKVA